MPTLFIMMGCPGSGKSTLAKKLAEQHKAIICSADDYHMVNGEYKWHFSKVAYAHGKCQSKALMGMCDKVNVVVDNTNTSAKETAPYVEAALKAGYDIQYVEPDTEWRYDVDELVVRNTHNVPRASIEKMLERLLNYKKELANVK